MSYSNNLLSPGNLNGKARPQSLTQSINSPKQQQQQQHQHQQSYRQPVGTSRSNSTVSSIRPRSYSESSKGKNVEVLEKNVIVSKKRTIFCDVVVEGVERMQDGTWVLPETFRDCILSLGTPFEASNSGFRSRAIQPPTPKKALSVDPAKVRQHLRELWTTEESYLRKITSLNRDFAKPLRSFAKDSRTAVIPIFEAKHLFSNIDDLVPISQSFESDLRVLINELSSNTEFLPTNFGEIILYHVERMTPFKKWLSSVTQAESIYQNLVKSNNSFNEFIDRTQIHSRESARTTSGFKEFLAEPFQRVSRYRLMIDPMIQHLPATDVNVRPLEKAVKLLTDICNMQVDEATRRTAAMWSLKEAIEGFPPAMINFDRHFIDCIDVDEIIDSPTSSAVTILRCTLFLFSDKVLITKRPSGEKGGRQHAGLDNIDNLVQLYSTSNLTNTQNSLLGSPKKLKRGVLGFRGVMDILEVGGIDFGGPYMGLILENPPVDQSERWNNRSARRFVVASTYPSDIRSAEKSCFLNHLAERQTLIKTSKGAMTRKSIGLSGGGDESTAGEETIIYWSIWQREIWEREIAGRLRGQVALQLDEDGEAEDLAYGIDGGPSIVARATLLENPELCRFSVRSRNRSMRATENIGFNRIPSAIAEIGTSSGYFDFPQHRPTTPSGSIRSRSRPRSLLLSASSALDIFSGSTSLKRGYSTASKASTNTSASHSSWGGSSVGSITPNLGSLSPNPSAAAQFFKKNSPVWYGSSPASKSVSELEGSNNKYDESFESSRMEEDITSEVEEDEDAYMEILKSKSRISPIDDKRRRHSSLPPPAQPRFGSISPQPQEEREISPSYTSTASQVFSPTIRPSQMSSLSNTTHLPIPTETASSNNSSPRRRVQGPRPIGSSAPSTSLGNSPISQLSRHNTMTLPLVIRSNSPSPMRRERSTTPPPNNLLSQSKRPLYDASPRASPSKKTATLSTNDSLLPSKLGGAGRRSPNELRVSATASLKGRTSNELRKARRNNGSGTSTIRGSSPPLIEVPNSISMATLRGENLKENMNMENKEETVIVSEKEIMKQTCAVADSNSTPAEILKVHIWQLRNKLALELTSKGNEKLTSSNSISRSPHTRNVFLQSTNIPPPTAPSIRKSTHESKNSFDIPSIIRWADRLNELVENYQSSLPPVLVPEIVTVEVPVSSGIKQEEYEKVVHERDMAREGMEDMREEMELLKAKLASISAVVVPVTHLTPLTSTTPLNSELLAKIEFLSKENLTLKSQYIEITSSIDALYTNFDEELEGIFAVARSGEAHDLAGALHSAVREKKRMEKELSVLKRKMEMEVDI